jgi:predicted DNA-binding transcriptional regulator AlpA
VADIDPIHLIDFDELVRRTGYAKSTVHKFLAEDAVDKTPGRRFPQPVRKTRKLMWREITIVRWMEVQEASVDPVAMNYKRKAAR